jgi:DNA-binding MarR family transcriptional regulator
VIPSSFPMSAPTRIRKNPAPIDSPERRRLPVLLRQAWYGLNQAFRRRIAHLDLTPDQFTVMRTLLEAGEITQSELTQRMTSDPNTVASLVERMQKAGLVERRPHETDRRAHRICVLPAGKRRYSEARQVALELQAEVLSSLPGREREQFLRQLEMVAESCRLAVDDSPRRNA